MKRKFLSTLCLMTTICFLFVAQAGVKIVVLGSSTAEGAGVTDSNNAWVNKYRSYLQSMDPTTQVINLAKGGYTTCRIMPTGTDPYTTGGGAILEPDTERNITKALSYQPDGIIINMPTNDISNGIPITTQMEHFATIINLALAANVKIWITTSQPHNYGEAYDGPYSESKEPDYWKQQVRNKFKELTNEILQTYGEYAINFYEGIATEDGYSFIQPVYNSGDGVHLNDAAHNVLFERVKAKNIPAILGDSSSDGVLVNPVFLNFGVTPAGLSGWNDINAQNAGYRIDGLFDASNIPTSLSLSILTGFTHTASNGSSSTLLGMNDAISQSNFSSNGPDPVIEIFGFSPNLTYEFSVFASRSGDPNRETIYTFVGDNMGSATLDATNNSENLAIVSGIKPDQTGKVTLTLSKSANNTKDFSYINAMKITSSTPTPPEEELPEGAIKVITAGTLASLLPTPTDTITTLTLYGPLNGTDIVTIMGLSAVKHINMKNTSIVAGGDAYLNGMKTRDNVFPQEMFYNNKVLESIVLPENVTDVLYHTFMGCTALKKVVIPETVSVFGNDLFSGCTLLEDVVMPASMTSIGSGCFYKCANLTSIRIPDGVKAINGSLFYFCTKLHTIDLPETIEAIEIWAFSGCSALKEIKIGPSIAKIVAGAFYNCSSLNTITCKAKTFPVISAQSGYTSPFVGSFKPANCTLKVPFTTVQLYRADDVWGVMNTIIPLETITVNGETVDPVNAETLKTVSALSISGSMSDAEGLNLLLAENNTITSIDMTGVSGELEILATGNPNCLMFVSEGAGLEGDNIIVGNHAKKIVLTDAQPFHSPESFSTEEVVYARNLGVEGKPSGKGEAKGWSTITLPFNVNKITTINKMGESVELASYDESGQLENGKNPFWLRKITASGFENTDVLAANTPYIICFPNHADYDDRYNIVGDVTFAASDCNLVITPDFTAHQGNEYNMTSTLKGIAQSEGVYAINDEGSAFENNTRSINPFECYVSNKSGSQAPAMYRLQFSGTTNLDRLILKENKTNYAYVENGVVIIESDCERIVSVYDISGKLIRAERIAIGKNQIKGLEKGMYIIDNQKIIF